MVNRSIYGISHPNPLKKWSVSGAIGDISVGQILKLGFSWRSVSWQNQLRHDRGWWLETNIKSGKSNDVLYDMTFVYFSVDVEPVKLPEVFQCLDEALTQAIYSFGGGRSSRNGGIKRGKLGKNRKIEGLELGKSSMTKDP